MKALTIDAYWAWAIARGSKRIENRKWQTHYRGPLAIHAGRNRSRDTLAIEAIEEIDPDSLGTPEQIDNIRGKIIATCELVHIADGIPPRDPWAAGPFCWMLANVNTLGTPVPASGTLGLWNARIKR